MKRPALALLCTLCAALLCGCADTPIIETYTMLQAAEYGCTTRMQRNEAAVFIPTSTALGIFEQQHLIERRGQRLIPDPYRVWSPSPVEAIPAALQEYMEEHTTVAADLSSDSTAPYMLRTHVLDWSYAATPDVSSPTGWAARVDLTYSLINRKTHETVLRQRVSESAMAAGNTYPAIVQTFAGLLQSVSSNCASAVTAVLVKGN